MKSALSGRIIANGLVLFLIALAVSTSNANAATTGRDRPAAGQLHGKPFTFESGVMEEGILHLCQGKEFFADLEVIVFLFLPKGEVPSGKTFTVPHDPGLNRSTPHIHIHWKETQKGLPQYQMFTDNYTMRLTFGQMRGNMLPGTIELVLPDETKSHIAGAFTAEVRGFRFKKDGKPDLASDSFTTLDYVARQYLEKTRPGQAIKIISHYGGVLAYRVPSGKPQFGCTDIVYQPGDGRPTSIRLQFIKDAGVWRVYRTLNMNQLHQAHPLKVPGPGDRVPEQFEYLAAKKLEETLGTSPEKGIYDTMFTTQYNPLVKMGQCGVQYSRGEKREPFKKVYLMRLSDAGWILDRELAQDEKVNYKKGIIEKK
jgi:hypothetical protein